MKILLMLLVVAFTTIGCAGNPTEGMTEAEIVVWESQAEDRKADREYERQVRAERALEKFYRFERGCALAGGFVQVKRWNSMGMPHRCRRHTCPPRQGDTYSCVTMPSR